MNSSLKFKRQKQLTGRVFAPAPVMQFNINQRMVPSVATFRMKIITVGYNIQSFDVAVATD